MADLYTFGAWTIWNGGAQPVVNNTLVQVQLRIWNRNQAESKDPKKAQEWSWLSDPVEHSPIIAYRTATVVTVTYVSRFAKITGSGGSSAPALSTTQDGSYTHTVQFPVADFSGTWELDEAKPVIITRV